MLTLLRMMTLALRYLLWQAVCEVWPAAHDVPSRCAAQVATDQVARALKVRSGALIQFVAPNSPAAKAGLLPTRRSTQRCSRLCPVTVPVHMMLADCTMVLCVCGVYCFWGTRGRICMVGNPRALAWAVSMRTGEIRRMLKYSSDPGSRHAQFVLALLVLQRAGRHPDW